ncbi:hypothetical protein B0H19DRAFT_1272678 [Mycena capillaripes]|nr:hypothetical protein B0H19DRAFT_1272678 [Mycena capillaripes]
MARQPLYRMPRLPSQLWKRLILIRRRKENIVATVVTALRTPFPPIAALVAEESDKPLTPDDPRLAAVLADAPAFVKAWCTKTQELLVSLPDLHVGQSELRLLERTTSVPHGGSSAGAHGEQSWLRLSSLAAAEMRRREGQMIMPPFEPGLAPSATTTLRRSRHKGGSEIMYATTTCFNAPPRVSASRLP